MKCQLLITGCHFQMNNKYLIGLILSSGYGLLKLFFLVLFGRDECQLPVVISNVIDLMSLTLVTRFFLQFRINEDDEKRLKCLGASSILMGVISFIVSFIVLLTASKPYDWSCPLYVLSIINVYGVFLVMGVAILALFLRFLIAVLRHWYHMCRCDYEAIPDTTYNYPRAEVDASLNALEESLKLMDEKA